VRTERAAAAKTEVGALDGGAHDAAVRAGMMLPATISAMMMARSPPSICLESPAMPGRRRSGRSWRRSARSSRSF